MNGEIEITSWFAAQSNLSPEDYPIGIGDDMAQMRVADGASVLVTTDMLLEGVHFDLSKTSIEQAGYKAMAVNLSDCAAMATVPTGAVCSVGLPAGWGADELKQLHTGITTIGKRFGCPLIGGDITRWDRPSGGLTICISMLSRPVNCRPLRRSGAKPGDCIAVTGSLGGSILGRHFCFIPRVAESLAIVQLAQINAMIDVSDGISTDLNHICRLSGVGARVEAASIPLSLDAMKRPDPLRSGLDDGEDFELLFTLAPKQWEILRSKWRLPTPLTLIGEITRDTSVILAASDGKESRLAAGGYDHLSGKKK
ncbi:MAG TPA: thiamine-phosphate kinase [Sedimentisphaerales bacterium]|nr:thiamine-phosphate kinase [Sedimentisphaerales bacterium]